MAIKSGQILHVAGRGAGYLVSRIQNAGGNLTIPEEKLYELGNYQSVATVRDTPELSFDIESTAVNTDWEALLLGKDPTTVVAGQEFDFIHAIPLDVISPFKDSGGSFNVIRGVAMPYLSLENLTYRFGVGANATQSATLRGDSIHFIPGSPYVQQFTITAGANQVYTLTNTAILYSELGDSIYALSVCAKNPTTGAYTRLFFGTDYTNTPTTVTTLENLSTQGYTLLHVTYGSTTVAVYPQSVHPLSTVTPAAIRSRDIDIYLEDQSATPVLIRIKGAQDFEATRRVTLDKDEEFGNPHVVSYDYDVAEVSGSFTIKPEDPTYLFNLIAQIANVSTTEISGALTSDPLAMELRIYDPDDHDTLLKTLYVPDARFTVPSMSGTVQQKATYPFAWSSDTGTLLVYNGARA